MLFGSIGASVRYSLWEMCLLNSLAFIHNNTICYSSCSSVSIVKPSSEFGHNQLLPSYISLCYHVSIGIRIAAALPDLVKALQLMKFDWALECQALRKLQRLVEDLGTKQHVNVPEDAAAWPRLFIIETPGSPGKNAMAKSGIYILFLGCILSPDILNLRFNYHKLMNIHEHSQCLDNWGKVATCPRVGNSRPFEAVSLWDIAPTCLCLRLLCGKRWLGDCLM